MKKFITIIIQFLSKYFYLYNWLKPFVCKYWGHKRAVRYQLYPYNKKRWRGRDKQHKTGGNLEVVDRFDPYYVYFCSRCGKQLGFKKLARRLSEEQALEFSNNVLLQFKAIKEMRDNGML